MPRLSCMPPPSSAYGHLLPPGEGKSTRTWWEDGVPMLASGERPRVAVTMGDVAGIGPEVIARAWSDPVLHQLCSPLVIGDPDVLRKALELVESRAVVAPIDRPEDAAPATGLLPCIDPRPADRRDSLLDVPAGQVDARAGRAAYEFL